MEKRVIVLTGASSGIGAAAALELASRGALVVPVGRDRRRLETIARRLGSERFPTDFASLAAVRRLAARLLERYPRIDVLVNNAGLVAGRRTTTQDGFELTFAVNHLAPFLLTNLLAERLRASSPARVVNTSSDAHRSGLLDLEDLQGERSWSTWSAYSRSKLANILFTRSLARRLEGTGVTANCLHPGVIRTRLGRGARLPVRAGWKVASSFFGRPAKGAATIVYLADAPEPAAITGAYFVACRQSTPSSQAQDDELAERLWHESAQLVGLEQAGMRP
jgi:NAD(P)-dependent dehydrogenase (short-subunit alcohol dehydrogenase family)